MFNLEKFSHVINLIIIIRLRNLICSNKIIQVNNFQRSITLEKLSFSIFMYIFHTTGVKN